MLTGAANPLNRTTVPIRGGPPATPPSAAPVDTFEGTVTAAAPAPPSPPDYEITAERGWLTMPDGVRLSVTWFRPVPREEGETFPALLEMLPYRKDDMFYQRDYPLGAYFARRGYVVARVDVRGTGSSEGAVPSREYSEQELEDAVEVIDQLSKQGWSNGKVGMYGISWSGFNAIQAALRKPPALAAILAVDASDDLYHDDVHYLDGAYHVDRYEVSIDNDLGMPDSLEYRVDEAYFRDRFDREPWFLGYLRQQRDGEFWRRNSQRFRPEDLQVPAYLVGGLLDYYRDSVPRMMESSPAPVKAEIGPWNHAWPDNGEPGPNYEWRKNLVRWWDYWLKGRDTGIMDEPRFTVFMREGHPPDESLKTTPGHWRHLEWPASQTRWWTVFPTGGGGLAGSAPAPAAHRLEYRPGSGTVAGQWWGEPTGDMGPDDAGSLVYDTPPLDGPVEIAGLPRVRLKAAAGAPLAHWSVRLEDVAPDGSVSLVTGAVLNGAQRESRLDPKPLVPGEVVDLELDLHFTTWTFQPGHRVRLAVSNAQFPMIWPTPHPMETSLHLGEGTRLELPTLPAGERREAQVPPPEPREERPDARSLPAAPLRMGWTYDPETGETRWERDEEIRFEIADRRFRTREQVEYAVRDDHPAGARFLGQAAQHVELEEGRSLDVSSRIEVRSDERDFHVAFTRRLEEDGRLVRERTWRESIPRDHQ